MHARVNESYPIKNMPDRTYLVWFVEERQLKLLINNLQNQYG